MASGFVYRTAVIDWASRKVLVHLPFTDVHVRGNHHAGVFFQPAEQMGTIRLRKAQKNPRFAGFFVIPGMRWNAREFILAGGLGFEPRLAESESAVLPLDDPPNEQRKLNSDRRRHKARIADSIQQLVAMRDGRRARRQVVLHTIGSSSAVVVRFRSTPA